VRRYAANLAGAPGFKRVIELISQRIIGNRVR
jgi:hypothetical protein